MKDLLINDVFPLIDIPDNSLSIFLSLVSLGLIFLFLVSYVLYKKFFNTQQKQSKKYINILKNCDVKNSKQSAYMISYYGLLLSFKKEDKKLIQEIISDLSDYKYKKESDSLSSELQEKLQYFIKHIESKNV